MRISAGSAKGRKVILNKSLLGSKTEDNLRPTSAKVRQALFNILYDKVSGSDFLDLYSGTGAVGLESLSRGAAHVVFVERNQARFKAIRTMVERFGFADRTEVVKDDVLRFLKVEEREFDIIFIDPPYDYDDTDEVFELIGLKDLLKDSGVVVWEHSSRKSSPAEFGKLKHFRSYRYGDTALSIYSKGENK
ncbi:MAG: 16S rRNA (guanine(966)-N(2))-methyltransferase RsmD [Nitrospirae bacterium]|nr:16S rRNA (guanine(966)-N(2))-methyltransferase RsmD [Nitrospirota bacterium]